MLILAFDCSLDACSAAIYDSDRMHVLSQRFQRMERGQSEAIALMARDVAAEAGITFREIDRIAVTLGPGTFTGIRIGLAFAKGLGLTLAKPVIGVDSLRAIAANARDVTTPIVVVNDARQDHVYLGVFRMDETLLAPRRLTAAEAVSLLPEGSLSVMGQAKTAMIAAAQRNDITALSDSDIPNAANFAKFAVTAVPDTTPLRPLYLAESYAKLPKPKIEIAVAQGSDATLLAQLHAACFDPAWTSADLAKLLAMPGDIALIARQARKPVAFLLIRGAADEAEIITIGTHPQSRRQGIGARLIEAALAHLRKRRIDKLIIEVADTNEAALGLYRKIGFAPVGKRRDYYERADGKREDAVLMRMDIPA